jgi:hypothetical protein
MRLFFVLACGVAVIGGIAQFFGEERLTVCVLLAAWLSLGTAYLVFRWYLAVVAHFGAPVIAAVIWTVMPAGPGDSVWMLAGMLVVGAIVGIAMGGAVALHLHLHR